MSIDLAQRLTNLRKAISARVPPLTSPHPAFCLFLSVSDGNARAQVVCATGTSFEAAWQKGLLELRTAVARHRLQGKWLRVDWIEETQATTIGELKQVLSCFKRNYFRLGLAFDPDFTTAFLEQELNANAMLYGGNQINHSVINDKNIAVYAKRKFGDDHKIDLSDQAEIYVLSTSGVFCDEQGEISLLNSAKPHSGRDAGRRNIERLEIAEINNLIETSSQFLTRQVKPKGAFIYGYHPCFNREINAYNTLRHASSTYSMIEAWEVTQDATLKQAIDRALAYLRNEIIRNVTLADGTQAAFVIDIGNEVKLGANAVAILALTKYATLTGSTDDAELLERLALGILHMQNPEDGSFVHVLEYPSLRVKTPFRIIYYDGEAAFGLMRLYNLSGDPRWLAAVEKAFEHFIAAEHWKHNDHWLSYCVNELTLHRPETRYFQFGIKNVADHLDFVQTRITTFPTLLELMMAARAMLERMHQMPEMRSLLEQIDLAKFHQALEFRAHHLLNGYFWPEMAMFFGQPDAIVGSFFIRHHSFRVRIDDVEHYLSGFIAYRKYRLQAAEQPKIAIQPPLMPPKRPAYSSASPLWTAENVLQATGGTWLVPPKSGWHATGMCIFAPAMQAGNMVIIRSPEKTGIGVLSTVLPRLQHPPACIITSSDDERVKHLGAPVLYVKDTAATNLAMGSFARDAMSGKILAVTGSAGKTSTISMLEHVLQRWGAVSASSFNANLPHGVAWNLASMPWDVPHIVTELAVGKMARSAALARPHVAIFTNILPAHLGEGGTVVDIAQAKSAIFQGMTAGSKVILNRDMMEWETVYRAAKTRELDVLHYGITEDSEFQLIHYDWQNKRVTAKILDKAMDYALAAAGKHMALNSLAVLAAVHASGYAIEPALEQLASFQPLSGRGEVLELVLAGRTVKIIDDAYNANPGSMQAALQQLSHEKQAGRRIAVICEMRDLGPEVKRYHDALAQLPFLDRIDRFYLMGELYSDFWKTIRPDQRGHYARTLDELREKMTADLADGDIVLFKGSNGTKLHTLVAELKQG